MKHNTTPFLLLALVTLCPVVVSAQIFGGTNSNDFSDRPSIGIKAGLNLSNVYDTQGDAFKADSKPGLAAGFFFTAPFTKYFGVQPEILYSQKGYQGSGSTLGNNYSFTNTTNYIDVPILLTINATKNFTLLVGPQYSFLLSQNQTYKSGTVDVTQEETFNNENLRKNTLCFTGGFDINLNYIVLSARAGWDVLSNKGDGTSSTPRYKNMWYQATVGIRL